MKSCNLMFVDDEIRIIRSLSMTFRRDYEIFSATSGEEALDILRNNSIHVMVSDQRMPGMMGVELLRRVKALSPNTMRILLTGYSDVGAVVNSINEGEIYRYITKPWMNEEVRTTIDSAAKIAMRLFEEHEPASRADAPEAMLPLGVGVLVLDNQMGVSDLVAKLLGDHFKVFVAQSFQHAVELMEEQEIGLIMADVRAFNANNVTLLKILKREYPLAVSVVLTDQYDADLGIELINQGQVFRYVTQFKAELLRQALIDGLRYYQKIRQSPADVERHNVEPFRDPEALRIQTELINRLPNIRQKMARVLARNRPNS